MIPPIWFDYERMAYEEVDSDASLSVFGLYYLSAALAADFEEVAEIKKWKVA